jgi:hypothetical protein
MNRKFYVLTTEKTLNSAQKSLLKEHFKNQCSDLPMVVLDRGFKLSFVDEAKGLIVSINDGNIQDIINGA